MYRVCIADDEEYIRQSIIRRLENTGIPIQLVGTAEDGKLAEQLYKAEKPDLFFVDIRMPGISGLDFIERVKKQDAETRTKFIIISGYDDFGYMQRAIKMGVSDYIKKPIQQDEFEEMIQAVCHSIDEEKMKQSRASGFQQNYWDSFCQAHLNETVNGTFLLIYRKQIRKYTHLEAIKQICPSEDWLVLVFHGIENAVLLYGPENSFREAQELSAHLHCHVAVKTGKQISVQEVLSELNDCMGQRFCRRVPFVEQSTQTEIYEGSKNTELSATISNTKEDRFTECIADIINDVFRNPRNTCYASQVFQSVIAEIANGYIQYGKPIPEEIRQEFMPMALAKYGDSEELQEVITGYASRLNAKLAEMEKKKDMIERVAQYINQHYMEDISLAGLAEEFFLAPTYLAKKFKEKKGRTIIQYLEELRIGKAKELLHSSDLSVSEIAMKTGYNDSNYFARSFRKVCKMTPREYRNTSC